MQQTSGQLFDRRLKCGREQQVLALGGQEGQDLLDVADEAHIEHAIGFIKHQDFHPVELHGVLLGQIHQPPRRSHQHISAATQTHHLGVDLHPAKHHIRAQIEVPRISRHVVGYLGRQLAGGREHQRPHHIAAGMGAMAQSLQHRQGEAGRLTGAGLGRSHHIAPLEHRRDALGLDRRGLAVALLQHRLHDRASQPQIRKRRARELFLGGSWHSWAGAADGSTWRQPANALPRRPSGALLLTRSWVSGGGDRARALCSHPTGELVEPFLCRAAVPAPGCAADRRR